MKNIQTFLEKIRSHRYCKSLIEQIGLWERVPDWGVRVGLEIGNSSLKVVQVRESAAGVVVEKMACKDIHGDTEKSSGRDSSKISESIEELWQELKLTERRVRMVISDPEVYTRQITIPKVGDQEISKAVKWQAEKYAPFPIEHALVDYQVVDDELKKDPLHRDIVIVAAPRNVIDKYIVMLRTAHLVPTVIDIAPFATARAVIKTKKIEPDELLAVIDIGTLSSTVIIISRNSLVLIRAIEISGKDLARNLTALASTAAGGQLPGSENQDRLLGDFAGQIELCFAYCEREFLTQQIRRVILCGGAAGLPGLNDFLSRRLNLPVELANPLQSLIVGDGIPMAQRLSASRMLAVLGEVI